MVWDTNNFRSQDETVVIDETGHTVARLPLGVAGRSAEDDATQVEMIRRTPELVASLKRVTDWMRLHTGPSDGTESMLIEAVEILESCGVRSDIDPEAKKDAVLGQIDDDIIQVSAGK